MSDSIHRGSCLCGAVRLVIHGDLAPADACHCTRCRKLSGHFWASTDVPRAKLEIQGEDRLTWYATSELVRRGFCSTCGSNMLWDPTHKDIVAVAMGVLDPPTGGRIAMHIHVASKGDYYTLEDGIPQNAE